MKLLTVFTFYCAVASANRAVNRVKHHEARDSLQVREFENLPDDIDAEDYEVFAEEDDDNFVEEIYDDVVDFFDDGIDFVEDEFDSFDDDDSDDGSDYDGSDWDDDDEYDTIAEPDSYNITAPGLAVRANDSKFKAMQTAAGKVKLKAGKSYYFLFCNKWLKKPKPEDYRRQGGVASEWVHNNTMWAGSPNGCSHVGLVIGQVKEVGKGSCLTCSADKTFEGKIFDVMLAIDRSFSWVQRVRDWRPNPDQTLFFRGEVGKNSKSVNMETLYQTLTATGEKWMDKASPKGRGAKGTFDKKFNCLTYYNTLEPKIKAA